MRGPGHGVGLHGVCGGGRLGRGRARAAIPSIAAGIERWADQSRVPASPFAVPLVDRSV
jgi:hypothetical protein